MSVTVGMRAERNEAGSAGGAPRAELVVIENFGSCNLRCAYCFPEHMWARRGHQSVISEEAYRGILELTCSATTAETVHVRFAGGEPLLAGQEWLEAAIATGREIAARHGHGIAFSLQTNATRLTPDLARLLVAEEVDVGISLDGGAEINEQTRGETEATLRGFHALAEALGRPPGIIVTVTRCNARRMREVIAFLEQLGVLHFRANQMGATASWNVHTAPRAEEWATARRDVFEEIVARRGALMEFNLAQGVQKLVRSLLERSSPFGGANGCGSARCAAGRALLYFDRAGTAYPCPRSTVSPDAAIGSYTDADFGASWDAAALELDEAMAVPFDCRSCPAQLLCDYGCHAFNAARGNFFEVNCDTTKEHFEWLAERLDDVARVYLYVQWRRQMREAGDLDGVRRGVELPAGAVEELAALLGERLAERTAELDPGVLERRYGWRDDLVPAADLTRARPFSTEESRRSAAATKGGTRHEEHSFSAVVSDDRFSTEDAR